MTHEHQTTQMIERISALWEQEPGLAWIKTFLDEVPEANLYMVGGAVRDSILEKPYKDYDIVACGVAPEQLAAQLKKIGKVDLVGVNFGVFKFHPADVSNPQYFVDIALPRTEIPAGTGGSRDVEVASDSHTPIETDLARRDFTFNAMAFDMRAHTLIDPHGGRADLDARVVRAVGDPRARFQEDYTRVLRGLRFATQLDTKIESYTWDALKQFTGNLLDTRENKRLVPPETIGIEFLKALRADPIKTLELWDESGALPVVMPEVAALQTCEQSPDVHSEGTVWKHTLAALRALTTKDFNERFGNADLLTQLGVLLHDIGKPATQSAPDPKNGRIHFFGHEKEGAQIVARMRERIKFDSAPEHSPFHVSMDDLAWIIENHMVSGAMRASTIERKFITRAERGKALQAVMFCDAYGTFNAQGQSGAEGYKQFVENPINKVRTAIQASADAKNPLVRGADLIMRGIKQGPRLGEMLREARAMELNGEHDKEKIMSTILKNPAYDMRK
ncbi:MAG: CCA tRNA nucleotidyltransferase [Candidatus Magasanikbacteria bacterium]|nr:CCA tRNA nucleotidyltransferase [Candidatus Magasanikbacteria bacterium]